MPFTPLHFGSAIALGLPLRRYLHAPTLIAASVILDVEPLIVLFFGLDQPLHGYSHTVIAALSIGALLGCSAYKLERWLQSFFKTLLFESEDPIGVWGFLATGTAVCILHIIFDLPLYSDINILAPLFTGMPGYTNPYRFILLGSAIQEACIWAYIFGMLGYIYLIIKKEHVNAKKCNFYGVDKASVMLIIGRPSLDERCKHISELSIHFCRSTGLCLGTFFKVQMFNNFTKHEV
jgi:hypothetical protein